MFWSAMMSPSSLWSKLFHRIADDSRAESGPAMCTSAIALRRLTVCRNRLSTAAASAYGSTGAGTIATASPFPIPKKRSRGRASYSASISSSIRSPRIWPEPNLSV